ncbi:hypothetical protein JCM10213_003437 [Rhodosporidiobolus nylandii]
MTTLHIRPASTSWSTNSSSARNGGYPSHFLRRPLSSLSAYSRDNGDTRRLSVCSTLSAVSAASSTSASSLTGDRRRRSATLLDLEAELAAAEVNEASGDAAARERRGSGIRNSLLRAEEVLRASERERELERRRGRASFRTRQVHSAHLLEHLWANGGNSIVDGEDATEDLSIPVPTLSPHPMPQSVPVPLPAPLEQQKPARVAPLKRFSPKRLLKRARSIPVDLLLSPSGGSKRYSNDSSASEACPASGDRYAHDDPHYLPSPPHPRALPSAKAAESPSGPAPNPPRRAHSAADLLSSAAPTVVRADTAFPRPPAPLFHPHSHSGTLPTRLTHLPVPDNELPSKFSASSGDSIVHLVSFATGGNSNATAKNGGRFKDRARTLSKASASGIRSLRGRTKTPSGMDGKSGRKKGTKRKPSLANLFSGMKDGGSESSSAEKPAKDRAISFVSSAVPPHSAGGASSSTSGHRPSTSISSYAPSTATTDSNPPHPSRRPSRLGFFRSTIRDSNSTGGGASGSIRAVSGRSRSRTRSSGGISPSIISRPLSVATSSASGGMTSAAGDKRFSELSSAGSSSVPSSSEVSGKGKGTWARISRAVKGKGREKTGAAGNVAAKRALFESNEKASMVPVAKRKSDDAHSPQVTARLPSRIPLATVFPHAQPQAPARPPRPPKDLDSTDDTTFYGPAVKSRAAAIDAHTAALAASGLALSPIKSSAPRVRAKTSIPVAKPRAAAAASQPAPPLPPDQAFQYPRPAELAQHAATFGFAAGSALAAASTLLPPAPIYPAHSLPTRRWTPESFDAPWSPDSPSDSSSSGFTSDSAPRRAPSPFRSPSPARFRDLLPSATAQSSPERNERGLPVPLEQSPRSLRSGESPKKRAMGPEQVIVMEDQKEPSGPIADVRFATTELADLLSGLDDTENVDNSSALRGSTSTSSTTRSAVFAAQRAYIQTDVSDLSASLRGHLPHVDSIETLRSTVSDVPQDLKDLIDEVDDHISLSGSDIVPSFAMESASMGARGFADELEAAYAAGQDVETDSSSGTSGDEDEEVPRSSRTDTVPFGAAGTGGFLTLPSGLVGGGGEHTTGVFSSDGATATLGYESTACSFEGQYSTAGAVLRSMLSGADDAAPQIPPVPRFPPFLQGVPELQEDSESEEDEEDPRSMLRDSVREALEMERPSHGDKMFERVDLEVQLSALLGSPSSPASPERGRQAVFLSNHSRNGSMVSSTEGSLESRFTMSNSPTPFPRSGRPVRQSLARYSQDLFPMKRPSHRARPISELSSASSSEHDHLPPHEPTSLSLAQSSRSTNLSISSITSSPCPVPRYRRIPMLTRNPPPLLQPSFRFPAEKPSSAKTLRALGSPFEQHNDPLEQFATAGPDSTDEYTGQIASATIKTSTSPRFVRPLRPSEPGEGLPRPRLLELQQLEDGTVPPDTPPPSSPSVSDGEHLSLVSLDSRQPSLELERPLPAVSSSRNRSRGHHSRQTSRSSSIIQTTIVEEAEEPVSPTGATVELAVRIHLQPLSPIREPTSPQNVPLPPYSEPPSVEIVLSPSTDAEPARIVDLEEDSESDGDFELTAETNLEMTRIFVHFNHAADMELKRSWSLWPDTDASREALAHFNAPKTYHAILEFLFWSQNRFPSPPHLIRLNSFIPPAFDDPPTPPSPIRIPSPLHDSSFENTGRITSTPPSPDPAPPPQRLKAAPPCRRPLAAKAVNTQVASLSRSTSSPSKQPKEDNSPFTALPPRLGSKFRGVRAKMASKSPKKVVDTSFFGSKVSSRRQEQLDAAMRRLEGTGRPNEQRSDGETTDFTGVLEAAGEATDEFTFSKTPRLSTRRPQVRRKTALSMLR